MLLLTGATGVVGGALLRRLTAAGVPVRVLVRDSRKLRDERVRVQIALGDLADPDSFRHALRGVETVVHLAASSRDQTAGTIEQLNALATIRLLADAEQAGAKRFIYFSALGATPGSPVRFMRAKAMAETAVRESALDGVVFAPSIVYAPRDPWLTLLERLSLLPVMPIPGDGTARFAPVWAEDVAEAVVAVLDGQGDARRYELAGPDVLTHEQIVGLVLHSLHRPRTPWRLPPSVVGVVLRALEAFVGPSGFATAEEAELLSLDMVAESGAADIERLGVIPRSMADVLGA